MILFLLLPACEQARATDPLKPGAAVPAVVEIEETTVGELDGVDVPFGNVWEAEYAVPGGTKKGLSGMLFVPTGPVRVGAASEVDVQGVRWRVIEVVKREGHGVVRLERAPPGP